MALFFIAADGLLLHDVDLIKLHVDVRLVNCIGSIQLRHVV